MGSHIVYNNIKNVVFFKDYKVISVEKYKGNVIKCTRNNSVHLMTCTFDDIFFICFH